MLKKDLPACPVELTLLLISNKWKVLIIRDLLDGTKRFSELKKSINNISGKRWTCFTTWKNSRYSYGGLSSCSQFSKYNQ